MTADELARRAALWDQAERHLLADLERVGTGQIDSFDLAEYHALLEPLEAALMQSRDPQAVLSGPVHRARRAIRNCRFRPTYDELSALVREALSLPEPQLLSGADAAARRVVRRPLALPSAASGPGRQAFRDKLRRMRGDLVESGEWPVLEVVDGGQAGSEAAA